MCISSGPAIPQPRDTSKEPIKTAYDIPPELTEREALKKKKKKGPKSLIQPDGGPGMGQPTGTSFGLGSSYGGTQGVSGNPNA